MFNPLTKFEVSMTTCNEDMKGNAKCKNSGFDPSFGGLRGNAHRVHLWLDEKRIVDFTVSDHFQVTPQDRDVPAVA